MVKIDIKAELSDGGREVVDRRVEPHSEHNAEESGREVIDWHVERVSKG